MGFNARVVMAKVMASVKPIENGPKWKTLVQKENEGRSKVFTFESPVGGKRKHRRAE